ncbi:MAG: ABC transporter six-transmembrane domain-containing protein [Hyphomicrobiales bacterium]
MLTKKPITIGRLLKVFLGSIGITWALTLCEAALLALVPLFIGFAIDGLLAHNTQPLITLACVLSGLIVIGVIRRLYDTRAYGTMRVEIGRALTEGRDKGAVSKTNARLGMGRELVDFLEEQVPQVLNAIVQLIVAIVILYSFHPVLSYSALAAGVVMLAGYGIVHRHFFQLNAVLNQQTEKQVGIIGDGPSSAVLAHLTKLRGIEVKLSEAEAYLFGAIFTVLLGLIIFNLWFAAGHIEPTVGKVFSIISYTWEFAEAALILPASLQTWSRLSEITQRINGEFSPNSE